MCAGKNTVHKKLADLEQKIEYTPVTNGDNVDLSKVLKGYIA